MTITQGGTSKEEYEKQLVAVTAELKANPKDLALLQDLAVAQYNTGRLEDAAKTYLTMLSIKDDALVHNNYGNVLRDMNKTTEAIQQYQRALALNPALTVAYINLVAMHVKAGKRERGFGHPRRGHREDDRRRQAATPVHQRHADRSRRPPPSRSEEARAGLRRSASAGPGARQP